MGVALGYYFWVDRPPTPICEHKPLASNKAHPPETVPLEARVTLQAMKKLPIQDLKQKLLDSRIVENGYTVRDLSLAALSGFYLVDIEKALQKPLEEKWLTYGKEGETIIVYPDLKEEDYKQVLSYLENEKWPFKTHGLFKLLKSDKWNDDISLQNAFFLTPEFITFENLFSRYQVDRKDLLELILGADYGKLKAYHERHKAIHDLSEGERRLILLDYLNGASAQAAKILLKQDYEYALKKVDDNQAILILTLSRVKTPEAEKYAKAIITSPRSDRVRRIAVERLYEYAGNPLPAQFDLAEALKTYLPTTPSIPIKQNVAPVKPIKIAEVTAKTPKPSSKLPLKKEKIYIVQAKDSLPKVAKQFNVDVQSIKRMNGLESDVIKPGMALRIPLPQTSLKPAAKKGAI